MSEHELEYDVFIAGSGPLGATYARLVLDHHKTAKVLMVEVGAQESATIGANLKNAIKYQKDLDAFRHIIRGAMQPVSQPPASGYLPGLQGDAWMMRESRSSVDSPYNPDQDPAMNLDSGMNVTRAVGGQSTHWTCACPDPHEEELQQCPIERSTMRGLLQRAKKLLNVHDDQFEDSVRHQLIKKTLTDAFASSGRAVKSLSVAGERSKVNPEYTVWSGADTVLGDSTNAKNGNEDNRFKLLTEHLVVKFVHDGGKVTGALVRDLRAGKEYIIKAKVFVAACGLVCTPQLLWNSDIRHKALGHYLTGQSHTFCQVILRRTLIDSLRDPNSDNQAQSGNKLPIPLNDPHPQITIPYSTKHPYHTQLHCDAFSYGDVGPEIDHRVVLDLRFFGRAECVESNYVSFSYVDRSGERNTDIYGMPQPTFHFTRSCEDERVAQEMMKDMCDVAHVLGSYLPTALPQFIPQGIHATGTSRVGNDPHTSVADKNSRVRVDENGAVFDNLWIGGCNVIPDSTAVNPTLTAVAYAIQGANDVVQVLGGDTFLEE